ncbi:hypothetical protein X975_11547, partial [Stegodyphus mimosarum]
MPSIFKSFNLHCIKSTCFRYGAIIPVWEVATLCFIINCKIMTIMSTSVLFLLWP